MTTSNFVDYVPQSDRWSGMLKGTFKINENHTAGLEYFYTKTDVRTQIAPVPFGNLFQNRLMPNGQPNPYYPGNAGNTFTPAFTPDPAYARAQPQALSSPGGTGIVQPGYVNVKWRDLPNGARGDSNVNEQQRIAATMEGNLAGWDYNGAVTYNTNVVDQSLISGYADGTLITDGVLNGVINPIRPAKRRGPGAAQPRVADRQAGVVAW